MYLVHGNKLYSQWSLRAGILPKAFEIAYRETVIVMFAPGVTLLDPYQIEVSETVRRFMDVLMNHPAVLIWKEEAFHEPWFLTRYAVHEHHYLPREAGHEGQRLK